VLSKFGNLPADRQGDNKRNPNALSIQKIEQRQKRVLDFLQPFCIKAKWRKDKLVLVIFLNRKAAKKARGS